MANVDPRRLTGKTLRDCVIDGGLKGKVFLKNPEGNIEQANANAYTVENLKGLEYAELCYLDEYGNPIKKPARITVIFSGLKDNKEYEIPGVTKQHIIDTLSKEREKIRDKTSADNFPEDNE